MTGALEPYSVPEDLALIEYAVGHQDGLKQSRQQLQTIQSKLDKGTRIEQLTEPPWQTLYGHLSNLDQFFDIVVRHYQGDPPITVTQVDKIHQFLRAVHSDLDIYYLGRNSLLERVDKKQRDRFEIHREDLLRKYKDSIWSLIDYRRGLWREDTTGRPFNNFKKVGQAFIDNLEAFQTKLAGVVVAMGG
jgi:hypothetical protein